ncbi:uncharacterized protein K02A2.6 [Trichonephila clavipes]|nr:uncharacterized protein K02A2.6 [Trichonephila clavipes]
MEQQVADLLRQNQDLIRALQIRDDSHSHKCKIVPVTKEFLLAPDIPSDQTLDKLKDALKKHLTPKPLIIPSRHKFLNKKQTEGEGRVENEIDRLEKEGIIEKVDSSKWATPVVPVVKSDGSIRLCADYSVTLNPNLIVPQHPLPRLDEIFGSLNGGKQFTKLDFKHAYLQMKVHPDSQKLMTINTHKGLYICKRLMYGLNGAPAIWQRYVDGLFQVMDDARITGSEMKFRILQL